MQLNGMLDEVGSGEEEWSVDYEGIGIQYHIPAQKLSRTRVQTAVLIWVGRMVRTVFN